MCLISFSIIAIAESEKSCSNKSCKIEDIITPSFREDRLIITETFNDDVCLIDCYTNIEMTVLKNNIKDFRYINGDVYLIQNQTIITPSSECEYFIQQVTINGTDYNVSLCNPRSISYSTTIKNYTKIDTTKYDFEAGKTYQLQIRGKKRPYESVLHYATTEGYTFKELSWWNSSFNASIPIQLNTTTSLTNHTQFFNVTWMNGMNANFSDIRFSTADNSTELGYFIQSKRDGDWAWTEVKLNVSNSNGTQARLWFGSAIAISKSNGYDAYYFYDDFNRNDNTTIGGSFYKLSNGESCGLSYSEIKNNQTHISVYQTGVGCPLPPYERVLYSTDLSSGYSFGSKVTFNNVSAVLQPIGGLLDKNATAFWLYSPTIWNLSCYNGTSYVYYGVTPSTQSSQFMEMDYIPAVGYNTYLNHTLYYDKNTLPTGASYGVGMFALTGALTDGADINFDDFYIKDNPTTQPSYSFGTQENLSIITTMNFTNPLNQTYGKTITQVDINFTPVNPDYGGVNCTYFLDTTSYNAGNVTNNTMYNVTWLAIEDGTHNVTLWCDDGVTNVSIQSIFVIDTIMNTTLYSFSSMNYSTEGDMWGLVTPLTNWSTTNLTTKYSVNVSLFGYSTAGATTNLTALWTPWWNSISSIFVLDSSASALTSSFNPTNFTWITEPLTTLSPNKTESVAGYTADAMQFNYKSTSALDYNFIFNQSNISNSSLTIYARFELPTSMQFDKTSKHPQYYRCVGGWNASNISCTTWSAGTTIYVTTNSGFLKVYDGANIITNVRAIPVTNSTIPEIIRIEILDGAYTTVPSSTPTSTGGGGGGGASALCGNGFCEYGESSGNCIEDCGLDGQTSNKTQEQITDSLCPTDANNTSPHLLYDLQNQGGQLICVPKIQRTDPAILLFSTNIFGIPYLTPFTILVVIIIIYALTQQKKLKQRLKYGR